MAIVAMMTSCNDSKKDDTTTAPADTTTMDANAAARIADSLNAAHPDTTKMMANTADTLTKPDSADKMMHKHADSKMKAAPDPKKP